MSVRPIVFTTLLAVSAGTAGAQEGPFADSATADLVSRARDRHRLQESRIASYRARVYTRMDGGVGAGRFGRGLRVVAYETLADMHWERPNDLRVDVRGMRSKSFRLPGVSERHLAGFWTETFSSEPWFVPRTLGEEIQLIGIPDEPALHPLARGAEEYYRYAVTDSVRIALPEREVRALEVTVRPVVYGPMLVSGVMWVDADSLDVVRLTVTFVGEHLWEEDEDSPTLVQLEADLEYALHEGRFWLPMRQILTGVWTYRYMPGATLTSTAITTFSDFQVNPAAPLVFESPDEPVRWGARTWNCDFVGMNSRWGPACGERGMRNADTWEDGWFEINVPPLDTLMAFDFGTEFAVHEDLLDEEVLAQRLTEMAAQSEELPAEWSGHRLVNLDWNELLRFVGFSRVDGLSLALGVELETIIPFTTVALAGRLATATERLDGAVTVRRAAPRGLLEISAFRRVRDVEPWTHGLGVGNSAKALLLGHDDADYYLATGGGLSYTGARGVTRHLKLSFQVERQRSLRTVSGSVLHDAFFGDGDYPANPPIVEGDFVRVAAERAIPTDVVTLRLGAGGLMGEGRLGGRAWAAARIPGTISERPATLALRAGAIAGDRLPQFNFRLGGPATVRGYEYGRLRGPSFWSAQLEVVLGDNQWAAPVAFADAASLFDGSDPLVGVGAGASLFKGWMRVDVAKGVSPDAPVRVDIYFRAPR